MRKSRFGSFRFRWTNRMISLDIIFRLDVRSPSTTVREIWAWNYFRMCRPTLKVWIRLSSFRHACRLQCYPVSNKPTHDRRLGWRTSKIGDKMLCAEVNAERHVFRNTKSVGDIQSENLKFGFAENAKYFEQYHTRDFCQIAWAPGYKVPTRVLNKLGWCHNEFKKKPQCCWYEYLCLHLSSVTCPYCRSPGVGLAIPCSYRLSM